MILLIVMLKTLIVGTLIAEVVLTSIHNLCFGSKIRKVGIPLFTPVLLYRSGVYGVFISQTYYPDEILKRGMSMSFTHKALKNVHHKNMSVKCVPLYTPHLYSKTGVYRGIPILLIFDQKHKLWVLARTKHRLLVLARSASPRRF